MPTKNQLQEQNKKLQEEIEWLRQQKKQAEESHCQAEDKAFDLFTENKELEEENKKLKEYNEEWFRIYGVEGLLNDLFYDGYTTTKLIGGWNSGEEIVDEVIKSITELKEKIDDLKKQIPDKKGKKLSPNDKEVLKRIRDSIHPGPDDVCGKEDYKLLNRLLK